MDGWWTARKHQTAIVSWSINCPSHVLCTRALSIQTMDGRGMEARDGGLGQARPRAVGRSGGREPGPGYAEPWVALGWPCLAATLSGPFWAFFPLFPIAQQGCNTSILPPRGRRGVHTSDMPPWNSAPTCEPRAHAHHHERVATTTSSAQIPSRFVHHPAGALSLCLVCVSAPVASYTPPTLALLGISL